MSTMTMMIIALVIVILAWSVALVYFARCDDKYDKGVDDAIRKMINKRDKNV